MKKPSLVTINHLLTSFMTPLIATKIFLKIIIIYFILFYFILFDAIS
jgi:hypothetical protein